jgi:hypothetical protein
MSQSVAAPTVQQHPSGSTDHDPAAGGVPWTPVVRVRGLVPVINYETKEPAEQNSPVLLSAFSESAKVFPAAWILGFGCPGQ